MPGGAALGLGLAAGALSAATFASAYFVEAVRPFLFFAWYVTPLPLLVCGLSLGAGPILLGGAAGAAAVTLAAGTVAGASFAALHAAPAVWVALRAGSKAPPADGADDAGRILSELAAYASLALLAVLAFRGFDLTLLAREVQETIEGAVEGAVGGADRLAANPGFVESFSRLFPGLFGAWWVVMASVNAVIAQAIASGTGRARRATPAWSGLRTTRWLPLAFLPAAVAASLLEGGPALLGASLAMILGVPLLFQGLAVIHSVSRGRQLRRVLLVVCYGCLLVWPLTPVALALLAALGIVDHLGRFRTPGTAPS